MNSKFINKIKCALIIGIILLLAGAVVFGLYGFNNTADYKDGYELSVSVEVNIGDAAEVLKDSTDKYLNSKGVTYKEYALEKLDEGGTLIFKFTEDIKAKIDTEELAKYVESFMKESDILKGIDVTASYYEKNSFKGNGIEYVLIGAGVALVVAFVYALIMEKASSAFAVAIVSIASAVLFTALAVITRVPAKPFFFATVASSAVLAAVYAMGLVNRFNEAFKYSASSKKGLDQIAEEQTKSSCLRINFISILLILFAIAVFVLGPAYMQFLAIQMVLVVVASYLSSYFFTGYLWSKFKGTGKNKYPDAKSAEEKA